MILDFEKPIEKLNEKLVEMQALYDQTKNIELGKKIKRLSNKIKKLTNDTIANISNWQRVQIARHTERPYTLDYIHNISKDFIELHGDRLHGDDPTIIGGLATVEEKTIMLIGHQKGRDLTERQKRNFGMASPCGYRKSLRLMRIAEHFNIPVVIFIDTPGANLSIESENFGIAEAIAENIQSMLKINTPIISIIIGEGGSGGALALAMGDKLLMLENSWFSVISPEAASTVLFGKPEYKEKMASMLHMTANDMLNLHIIDDVIKEPIGGAHKNSKEISEVIKDVILTNINILERNKKKLVEERIEKYKNLNKEINNLF